MTRKNTSWIPLAVAAVALLPLLACGGAPQEEAAPAEDAAPMEEPVAAEVEQAEPVMATADVTDRQEGGVRGKVSFTDVEGNTDVVVHIEGAPPGTHGLHIHETGDCSADDFTSAGGHFNPADTPHACPPEPERHAGDLGNIEVGEDGTGELELTTDLITVSEGPSSVVGRAVILHADADDCQSQPTGAAGARLACGVIAGPGMAAAEMEGESEEMEPEV